MKQITIYTLAGLFTLLFGIAAGIGVNSYKAAQNTSEPSKLGRSNAIVAQGNWVSSAHSIDDLSTEADLIVRVIVLNTNVRKLKQTLPTYGGKDGLTVVGEEVDIMPFTDSKLKVIEVYKGSADKVITVMQTGGSAPASDGDPAINFAMSEDPIFEKGTEYILFLKDISRDTVHAKGRKLYITVNPMGRYLLDGQKITNFSEFFEAAQFPNTIDEFVSQIKQVVLSQAK